jgi:hypothetical protein
MNGDKMVRVQDDQRVVGEFVWPITYPGLLKSGCTNITGYRLFKGPAHEPCEEIIIEYSKTRGIFTVATVFLFFWFFFLHVFLLFFYPKLISFFF